MPEERAPVSLSDKDLFTTGEAAAICQVSQQTIIRCFDRGELEGFRIPGSRTRRIPRDALVRFMRRNELPPDALERASRRILVIDDSPDLAPRLREALEIDARFVVRSATSGFDGGMQAVQFKPDLILLNVGAPAIDPRAACQRMKGVNGGRRTVVLVLVRGLDDGRRRLLSDAGVDGFVREPIDMTALVRRISRSVPRSRARPRGT